MKTPPAYTLATRSYRICLGRKNEPCCADALGGPEPEGFPPLEPRVRIVHLSDLHNAKDSVRGGYEAIAEAVRAANPDLIAFTGDLFDKGTSDPSDSLDFLSLVSPIAPTYVVSGNHDRNPLDEEGRQMTYREVLSAARTRPAWLLERSSLWRENASLIARTGAVDFDGKAQTIEIRTMRFTLCGVRDSWPLSRACPATWFEELDRLSSTASGAPLVLLSHRPEYARLYASCGFRLALCGHTHGGQIRLPGMGSLLIPNQKRRPYIDWRDYVFDISGAESGNEGEREKTESALHLIVSAGLGYSKLFRFNCPPEIGIVDLYGLDSSAPLHAG
jgi:predicted MPP superfamily phosphohydrolase